MSIEFLQYVAGTQFVSIKTMVSNFKLQLITQVGWIYLISLVTWNCWSYLLHNFKSNILHEYEKSNKFNSNRKIWKIKKKKKKKKEEEEEEKKKKKRNFPGLYAYQNVLLYTYLLHKPTLTHT